MEFTNTPLQSARRSFQPEIPDALSEFASLTPTTTSQASPSDPSMASYFPKTSGRSTIYFETGAKKHSPKKVAVVFSGGPAAGGHNVITGLYDALKKLNPDNKLFGFCDGPQGILDNKYVELEEKQLALYRNQGGFDLIGTGRIKIETPEQFQTSLNTVKQLDLDGLVIIGGDDSNTNAALLAEYFISQNCKTAVVGVPKTIDGDLKSDEIEIPFGFDSATKTYSEIIGNILRDTLSAKKYYYFIKLMGRSASHVALECAMKTHPNMTLISEEIASQKKTLISIVQDISSLICERAQKGKDYGVILIPEGLIEFIPEIKQLIQELNHILADISHVQEIEKRAEQEKERDAYIKSHLSSSAYACYSMMPNAIKSQLLIDRDSHGNVQVSKIETEKLLIIMVQQELKRRKKNNQYSGKFSAMSYFCGYEGRSCFPSNFDAQYCYSLGHVAALLIDANATGYIACINNLTKPIKEWIPAAANLASMMTLELRHGKTKPVMAKALVNLNTPPFFTFCQQRIDWAEKDHYCYPGPMQFFGPKEMTESIPLTLLE